MLDKETGNRKFSFGKKNFQHESGIQDAVLHDTFL
jgi:hypothetical protein